MSPMSYRLLHSLDRSTRVALALGLTAATLACLAIGIFSGYTSSSGKLGTLTFAVVDSSNVSVTIHGKAFRGLPDANDFSRHKDFYAFYLWSYCSGIIRDGTYWVDFCSKPNHSLFDLFTYWKVWGASVHKEGTYFYWLEHGPKLLYIPYLIAGGLKFLEFLAGIPLLFNNKTSRVTLVLPMVGSASVLVTSILAQVTYGQLISRADDDDIPITARRVGYAVYAVNWVASALSLTTTAIWYYIVFNRNIKRVNTVGYTISTPIKASGRADAGESFFGPMRRRTTTKFANNY